uniref:Uncharacterized protein n=1 Tax=Meloidogyne incognita TaxID=6306 RepID=A0A914MH41_MELIC
MRIEQVEGQQGPAKQISHTRLKVVEVVEWRIMRIMRIFAGLICFLNRHKKGGVWQ